MKKIITLILGVLLTTSFLTGCSNSKTTTTTTEENTTEESTINACPAFEDNYDNDEIELNEKYVDFSNMSFAYKGKKYTIGETSIQNCLDNGIEFRDVTEEDLNEVNGGGFERYLAYTANIDNQTFTTVLMNFSSYSPDEEILVRESKLSGIDFYAINKDILNKYFKFSFSLDLTPEELIENSGEPTEITSNEDSDYEYYYYSSEDGSAQYIFGFLNGQLSSFRFSE